MFMSGGPPAHSKMRYAADTLALAVGDDKRQPPLLGAGRSGPRRFRRLQLCGE